MVLSLLKVHSSSLLLSKLRLERLHFRQRHLLQFHVEDLVRRLHRVLQAENHGSCLPDVALFEVVSEVDGAYGEGGDGRVKEAPSCR